MRQKQAARRLWPIVVASTFALITYAILGAPPSKSPLDYVSESSLTTAKTRDFDNLHLTEDQCRVTFPGLTEEIDLALAQGPFQLNANDASTSLLGQIKDNKVLIIRAPRPADLSDQWKEVRMSRSDPSFSGSAGYMEATFTDQRLIWPQRQRAALQQINRAIVTSPTRLPDTVFNLYIQDTPVAHSWSHSRPAISSSPRHTFPIPHFAFWSWDQPFIRSMSHAATATNNIEITLPFDRKDFRAIWRGTAWFNNGASANPRSRQELLKVTKDATWADVRALEWTKNGEDANNVLKIEDFCRHKYIIHTEGVSYSGRLQFHQMCGSVIISPPIEWMQHTTHLVKPVYSSVLLDRNRGISRAQDEDTKHQSQYPSYKAQETWPVTVSPEEANMVFVNPDWSDLEATIRWLEDHPEVANGIAQRQRALFVERGYLSPAAEVCYWRALIRGWSQVVRADDSIWENTEVTSWEEFSVRPERARKGH